MYSIAPVDDQTRVKHVHHSVLKAVVSMENLGSTPPAEEAEPTGESWSEDQGSDYDLFKLNTSRQARVPGSPPAAVMSQPTTFQATQTVVGSPTCQDEPVSNMGAKASLNAPSECRAGPSGVCLAQDCAGKSGSTLKSPSSQHSQPNGRLPTLPHL